ncbi:hypothetical protein AB3329_01940 [Streptococcus sp. H31]|uniref:hypothetical protein n=1 Tax=Streptococcus huangxiaojuni TaxID=3237239 RepID=UPI0034A2D91D
MRVRAIAVKALANYCIQVTYEDGKTFIYNVQEDIRTIKAFHYLKDEGAFSKVYLQYNGYSIAWGDGDEFEDVTMDCEVPYLEGELVLSLG